MGLVPPDLIWAGANVQLRVSCASSSVTSELNQFNTIPGSNRARSMNDGRSSKIFLHIGYVSLAYFLRRLVVDSMTNWRYPND